MGVYDTYGEVQLKVGPCILDEYNVGDKVHIPDGIYVGHEGFVVIRSGVFVTEFDRLTTKWGDYLSPKDVLISIDPFVRLAKAIEEKYENQKE